MQLVAFYPSSDLGSEPGVLRDYAQAAEELGYSRIAMGEHVLGADPERPGGWQGAYTYEHEWPDPFPAFAYMAAVTERIELMTGILILPQRQTALVAKQAAQLAVISGDRFILGIGTGWNAVEYEALGQDFHTRGRRMEEQISLLRALWAEPVVSFEGRWEHVNRAGINPLPPKRDIPIWMGGSNERAIERSGRLGQGWFPLRLENELVKQGWRQIRETAEAAGRDPDALGLQCSVMATGDTASQIEAAREFERLGATHVALFTGNLNRGRDPQAHLDALTAFAEGMTSR